MHNVYKRHDVNFYKRLEEHMIEYAIHRVDIQQRHEELAAETEKSDGKDKIVSVSRIWPMLATTTKEEAADSIATENKTEEAAAEQAADSIATENKTKDAATEQEVLAEVFRKMGLVRHSVDPGEKTPGPTLLQWDCVYCTLTNIQCLTNCMVCGNSKL